MPSPIIGPEILVNTSTNGVQLFPSVAATADGRFVIAWHDVTSGVYRFQEFAANGVAELPERRLAADIEVALGFAVGVSSTIENRIEVVGPSDNGLSFLFQGPASNGGDIFSTYYFRSFDGERTLNLSEDQNFGDQSGLEQHPFLVNLPTGEVFAGLIDNDQFGGGDLGIGGVYYDPMDPGTRTSFDLAGDQEQAEGTFLAEIEDDAIGYVFRDIPSGNVFIGTMAVGAGSQPHVAALAAGGVAVAWQGIAGDVLVRIYDVAIAEGGGLNYTPRTSAITVDGSGVGAQSHVCALQDGRLLVVWQEVFVGGQTSTNAVFGRLYNADGTSDSTAFEIDQFSFPTAGEPVTGAPRAAQLADGRIVVTYQDGRSSNADIKAKILDPRLEGVALSGSRFGDDHVGTVFDDIFVELAGNDRVAAGSGNDQVFGGGGNDLLLGEAGEDMLNGGLGDDILTGGSGNDRYVYASGAGADTIIGFSAGVGSEDRIDLTALTNIHTLADVLVRATQNGAHTIISFSSGDTLTLENVLKLNLNSDDFVGLTAVTNDFKGDGKSDILLKNGGGGLAIWQMNGTTVEANPQIGTMGAGWHLFESADFNADGKSDLLLQSDARQLSIWQMNGTQVQASPLIGTMGAGWSLLATDDFNSDGKDDILLHNASTRALSIWQMNGTQVQASPIIGTRGSGWNFADTGDFNGDGKADLLLLNPNTLGLSIWQMDGTTVVANPLVATLAPGWDFIAAADFNNDGKDDLLFQNVNTREVSIWQMNGTQVQSAPIVGTLAPGWKIMDTADFNADAKDDLLLMHQATRSVAIWQMNGTTVQSAPQVAVLDAGWDFVETEDFNADGKADILFENVNTGEMSIWQMNGTQIAAAPIIGTHGSGWDVYV
jgi:Ca2+-binding RTX toxin-like protein